MDEPAYLFVFGFESPEEWRSNTATGGDDESSTCVWIEAESEHQALAAGKDFAQHFVADLFKDSGIEEFPGWHGAGYAYWIERRPNDRWPADVLADIPRIRG